MGYSVSVAPRWNKLALRGKNLHARSQRPVMSMKKIYTLWGRNRFLLLVTYFPTNLLLYE